jgi:hypothetical protein
MGELLTAKSAKKSRKGRKEELFDFRWTGLDSGLMLTGGRLHWLTNPAFHGLRNRQTSWTS